MRFSVIVPVYNVRDYLPRCVDSVLAQDTSECEMILVDDGSTDGESGKICDVYAAAHPGLISVIHQKNGGLGCARNTGIAAARGEYLVFLDSDDYLRDDTLEKLSAAIDSTHADIYTFGFSICREGREPESVTDALPEGEALTAAKTPEMLEMNPSACNRIWKRELFAETGILFPARVWYEDIRTTIKLFVKAKSIVSLHQCFYCYTVREDSITHNTNVARNSEIMDAFDDLLVWFEKNGYYDEYKTELERLALEHVYIAASVRVLRIDRKSHLLGEFSDYMDNNFPGFMSNPRLESLTSSQKLVLKLLRGKKYGLIAAMFRIKGSLG